MSIGNYGRKALFIGLAGACFTLPALAQNAAKGEELVGPGYRRVHREDRVQVSPEQLDKIIAKGGKARVDAGAGSVVMRTIADSLPEGWVTEPAKGWGGAEALARVDSMGNPIVNEVQGLPAWAQRDVDALRDVIAQQRDEVARLRAQGRDATEAEGVLGNYVGQAIARAIDVADIVNLDGAAMMGAAAPAVLAYLNYYENIRFANQAIFNYQYTPAEYPAGVVAFIEAHGSSLAGVQEITPVGGFNPRGDEPCYVQSTFARGLTLLSGQTDIWDHNGFDDEQADIPTGFPLFFFYDCQDADNNTSVRVSTNGYISFFQQGGNAEFGSIYDNQSIPATGGPNGFAAPWWDDLFVASDQGTPDRVSYKTEGAVDQRVFTVEWFSVSRIGGLTDEFHYFQVKLYETTDVIEFHYGDAAGAWRADPNDSATVGVENFAGTEGVCGPDCGAASSSEPPSNYRFEPNNRPSNDDCNFATAVAPGAFSVPTLHRATADGSAGCGNSNTNRDVWYEYTALCNGSLRVTTCGSRNYGGPDAGVDTVLSAHTGCPGTAANQIACSDDASAAACAPQDSQIELPMTAGQRILFRVTHFGDLAMRFGSGAFQIRFVFTPTSTPANDNCSNAAVVANNATVVGNLGCATNDGVGGCGASSNANDLWYSFTTPYTGRLTVDACGSYDISGPGTGIDSVVSIHTGCPGNAGNAIECNDDALEGSPCHPLDSRVAVIMPGGQTVKIRVSHFGATESGINSGLFVLHVSQVCIADFNHNNVVNSQDFFDFLTAFFSAAPSADVNLDDAVNSQDFFDFLTVFFSGC